MEIIEFAWLISFGTLLLLATKSLFQQDKDQALFRLTMAFLGPVGLAILMVASIEDSMKDGK